MQRDLSDTGDALAAADGKLRAVQVARRFRRAGRRLTGHRFLRQGVSDDSLGIGILVSAWTLPVDLALFGVDFVVSITWFLAEISAESIMLLFGAMVASQIAWCRHVGLRVTSLGRWRRIGFWLALASPWTILAVLALYRGRGIDLSSTRDGLFGRRSSPILLGFFVIHAFLCLHLGWWLVAPEPLVGWRRTSALWLSFVLHVFLVICLRRYVAYWERQRNWPRRRTRMFSALAWLSLLPMPVPALFYLALGWEAHSEYGGSLVHSSFRSRGGISRHTARGRRGEWIGRTKTHQSSRAEIPLSFARLQRLRLAGEAACLGLWAPALPARATLVTTLFVGGLHGCALVGAWALATRRPGRRSRPRDIGVFLCELVVAFSTWVLGWMVGTTFGESGQWTGLVLAYLYLVALLPVALGWIVLLGCSELIPAWRGFERGIPSSRTMLLWWGLLLVTAWAATANMIDPTLTSVFGFDFESTILVILAIAAASGPVIGAVYARWLVWPRRLSDLFTRGRGWRARLEVAACCLLAIVPLSGLASPLWRLRARAQRGV